jgi:hypothetical protein
MEREPFSSTSPREPPMSSAEGVEKVTLRVRTADRESEIYVVDGHFELAARGKGSVESFQLDPGIYKVKVRSGFEAQEAHVVLRPGEKEVEKTFAAIEFASPAPLDHTSKSHDFHVDAAQRESREVHVHAGRGSSIFVFAREWTGPTRTSGAPAVTGNPAAGLTLLRTDGALVADLGAEAALTADWDPCAGCSIALDPGEYLLRLKLPSGETLEQTVVASRGWQTQLFLLLREYGTGPQGALDGGETKRMADLVSSSILLAPLGLGFTADSQELRQLELARLGLANERLVLPDDAVNELLAGKFENPMLGIYGAHLLLLDDKRRDDRLLHLVIANLRRLLGREHPDVEALALAVHGSPGSYVFHTPPMLQRSWKLIVEASVRSPDVLHPHSLASRVSSHLLSEGPWLLWLGPVPSRGGVADRCDAELAEVLREYLERPRRRGAIEGAPAEVDPADDMVDLGQLAVQAGVPLGELHRLLYGSVAETIMETIGEVQAIPRVDRGDQSVSP